MFEFLAFFQFLPLTTFIAYTRAYGFDPASWEVAFQCAAAVALFEFLVFAYHRIEINRFIMGVNLYLIFGGVGFFFRISWLLSLYAQLEQTALFASLVAVGLVTTFFSKSGFIQVFGEPSSRIRNYSYLLLLGVVAALISSFFFKNNVVYAGYIPYIGLLVYRTILVRVMKL